MPPLPWAGSALLAPASAALQRCWGQRLGICWGLGLVDGLRYVAAGILVYATAFALYDLRIYRKVWFMPLATAAMTAVTGFIYLSEAGWEGMEAACFLSEVVLAGVSCFCYQQLPALWEEAEEPPVAERLFLLATIAVAAGSVGVGLWPVAGGHAGLLLPPAHCARSTVQGQAPGSALPWTWP